MRLLGAHVPTAGGLANAPRHGREIAATAIQIFTRNQMQWRAPPLRAREARAFREALSASGVRTTLSHASYLINLASPIPELLRRSRSAFVAELRRCQALGVPRVVIHPGAHMGAGERDGLRQVARSLDDVLARTHGSPVRVLLEVTAGQGTYLCHRFEHLAEVLQQVARPERLGVCLDTCHLLAAGYDVATPRGYARTLDAFERIVGLARLEAVHLNDAKHPLGSRLDRHAAVGTGHLGLASFRRMMRDPRLAGVPMVLETPGGIDAWRREIALLRRMAGRAAS